MIIIKKARCFRSCLSCAIIYLIISSNKKMKKTKKSVLVSIAIFAMMAMAAPVIADNHQRGDLPPEDSMFWEIFSQMETPSDTVECNAALSSYISSHPEEFGGPDVDQIRSEMSRMCTEVAAMPSDMESNMASYRVTTNLFDPGNTNWHSIDSLYFQKEGDGGMPMGRISFSGKIDFMSYRFFNFMNNFDNMVKFDGGYVSLNASMVPDMINYGATLTMYQLGFDQLPDIYVSNGSSMRQAIEGTDISGIVWDPDANSLSFTPGHFSSYKAVQQGTKIKNMKISSVKKKTIKYNARKNTFNLTVKGKNLYKRGSDISCTLGFEQAQRVHAGRSGKTVKCTFGMASFSSLGTFPITISIEGQGEVTRTSAVRIK
jgi:hypothetical protein